MNNDQQFGHDFAKGVTHYLGKVLILGYVVIYCISWVSAWAGWWTDDSDVSGAERSGLRVHLDAKTGIEYLSDTRGGLVRRESK